MLILKSSLQTSYLPQSAFIYDISIDLRIVVRSIFKSWGKLIILPSIYEAKYNIFFVRRFQCENGKSFQVTG